ncbi:hypothetical protein QYM36_014227 [Artemia franciscana]|uniref:Uncharacterized protein n=1 Tax=Artemia franciscana TaxID=6661 RepID=A0AA88HBV8_ARTSF|nr:hypothetical protein QYM36_014227 [Artemia franciscana]
MCKLTRQDLFSLLAIINAVVYLVSIYYELSSLHAKKSKFNITMSLTNTSLLGILLKMERLSESSSCLSLSENGLCTDEELPLPFLSEPESDDDEIEPVIEEFETTENKSFTISGMLRTNYPIEKVLF